LQADSLLMNSTQLLLAILTSQSMEQSKVCHLSSPGQSDPLLASVTHLGNARAHNNNKIRLAGWLLTWATACSCSHQWALCGPVLATFHLLAGCGLLLACLLMLSSINASSFQAKNCSLCFVKTATIQLAWDG